MSEPDAPADIYDPRFVKQVFDRCSGKYIAFSWICSFGFTERWRRQCVELLPAPPGDAPAGYDLMAGTGEAWPHLQRRFPGIGKITAVDLSSGMHERALERIHHGRAKNVAFVEADLLALDLRAQSADFVIATFGLKTFNAAQQTAFARTVAHVLKPGGVFSFIEASDPKGWWLRPLYRLHLGVLLPLIEKLFLRGAQDFAMIATYTANFGDAGRMAAFLREQGLEVSFHRLFFGCATAVSGRKPAPAPN